MLATTKLTHIITLIIFPAIIYFNTSTTTKLISGNFTLLAALYIKFRLSLLKIEKTMLNVQGIRMY